MLGTGGRVASADPESRRPSASRGKVGVSPCYHPDTEDCMLREITKPACVLLL